jgi:hypothetical protein
MIQRVASAAMLGWVLFACGSEEPEIQLEEQIIEVACAHCVFEMPGQEQSGCAWAAHVDGEHYLLSGPVPVDHSKHEPEGICSMPRQARVDGYVHGEYFVATEFELLPAENVPEKAAHDHEH